MSTAKTRLTAKTILLLSDAGEVADQIEQALGGFCLTNNFLWHQDLRHFQQSLIASKLSSSDAAHVDLFLIAYVDDIRLTLETLAELRRLKRYALTPTIAFLVKDDKVLTRKLYHQGANTVLRYPLNFDALKQLIVTMDAYWFEAVSLPPREKNH